MKYLGLILVVALVAGQVLTARINENDGILEYLATKAGVSEKFKTFLEVKAKKIIREGDEKLGVPVMDPYVNKFFEYNLEEDSIKGKVELKDSVVVGVANYTVTKADVAMFQKKMTLGLNWSRISGKSSHKINVVAKDIRIWGAGDLKFALTDLTYETVVYLSISGGVKISKMETKISLGGLEFEITGLLDDEDLSKFISEIISDAVPQLVIEYQRELVERVDKIVMETVNKKLEGKSLKDILDMLN